MSGKTHLGPQHLVAEAAARLCTAHLTHVRAGVGIGGVACGACWEEAIRADERAVVWFDLPREIEPDPLFVDEVAVDRACSGRQVRLTRAEFEEAVRRLKAWGVSGYRTADMLGVNQAYVYRVRARLAAREKTPVVAASDGEVRSGRAA